MTPAQVRRPIAVFALALANASTVAAQVPAPQRVQRGSTVLLKVGPVREYRGTLAAADSGRMILLGEHWGDTIVVPLTEVRKASLLVGRERPGASSAQTGLAIGFIGGSVVAALGIAMSDPKKDDGLGAILSVFAGAAVLVGSTLIGAVNAVVPQEHWVPFDPSSIAIPFDEASTRRS